MPHSPDILDQIADLIKQATTERSHYYTATVLLLLAISQRFKIRNVRLGLIVIAVLLLCFPMYHILTLPRA